MTKSGLVQCRISVGLPSVVGHFPALPRRSIAVRFALNKQTLPLAHSCTAEATPSIDCLIGPQEELLGNCQAECLGRRKIDDEIELGRLLDRDVGRLRPA